MMFSSYESHVHRCSTDSFAGVVLDKMLFLMEMASNMSISNTNYVPS